MLTDATNNAGLRWTAVTVDDSDGANNALDRITIPQDLLDRIAPTALPRCSRQCLRFASDSRSTIRALARNQ